MIHSVLQGGIEILIAGTIISLRNRIGPYSLKRHIGSNRERIANDVGLVAIGRPAKEGFAVVPRIIHQLISLFALSNLIDSKFIFAIHIGNGPSGHDVIVAILVLDRCGSLAICTILVIDNTVKGATRNLNRTARYERIIGRPRSDSSLIQQRDDVTFAKRNLGIGHVIIIRRGILGAESSNSLGVVRTTYINLGICNRSSYIVCLENDYTKGIPVSRIEIFGDEFAIINCVSRPIRTRFCIEASPALNGAIGNCKVSRHKVDNRVTILAIRMAHELAVRNRHIGGVGLRITADGQRLRIVTTTQIDLYVIKRQAIQIASRKDAITIVPAIVYGQVLDGNVNLCVGTRAHYANGALSPTSNRMVSAVEGDALVDCNTVLIHAIYRLRVAKRYVLQQCNGITVNGRVNRLKQRRIALGHVAMLHASFRLIISGSQGNVVRDCRGKIEGRAIELPLFEYTIGLDWVGGLIGRIYLAALPDLYLYRIGTVGKRAARSWIEGYLPALFNTIRVVPVVLGHVTFRAACIVHGMGERTTRDLDTLIAVARV